MLQIDKPTQPSERLVARPAPSLGAQLVSFVGVVRRQLPLMLVVLACAAALGLAYLVSTPAQYTATGTMVIDTRKVQVFQQQSVLGDVAVDAGTVETQVQILKSENISLAVIKELRLTEDPEFVGRGGGALGAAIGWVTDLLGGGPGVRSEHDLTRRALEKFEQERTVRRVGLTYAMEVSFRSLSPDKAAAIVNAIADAYIVDQLEAKYQATRRASLWLQDRIRELRTQASAAERAVIEYKEKNNIVDTGGRLISEQQLAEVNSQLIMARAATAEAKARLDRINDILRQEIPNESVADALKNETIIKLRNQYVDLAGREATWSERYGRNHMAAVSLRNQMQEIRRNISQELQRIQQAYQSDYDIARAREDSIKGSLANVVSETQSTNQAQVQLRELESNAQTYRAMYDSFLQRYMEAVQQQSFPISEARLISPASRPLDKSHPRTGFVLAISVAGGLVLGLGIGYLREIGDNAFRTSAQVEEMLGAPCIAVLPRVGAPATKAGATATEAADGRIAAGDALLSHVVEEPFSPFAEGIRSLKVAADLKDMIGANRVIGITSTVPAEGKSVVAANLSQLIAHAGSRVVLIDADLRNPSLSRALAPGVVHGVVEVIAGRVAFADAVLTDRLTQLAFVPAGATAKLLHTNEVLASAAMKRFVDELRTSYDYVILDFPPLAPVVDVRATTALVDSYVYVIEWGRTRVDMVEHCFSGAAGVYDRLLGVVLNKASTSAFGGYASYRGAYYGGRYGSYGQGRG
ncbi:AAA family ATPase [Rhodoplanes sp. TEM]|uniref:non-specific protein-tyrosine kinase n=1 Tax=Rhodoplanes tepidamans TaxID=200616 RepID=A0ABT5JAQ4_RHOTP|nr:MULTISPECIES: AAA family ATPase [Rhodoplanes]MDC7786719.1 AAA family ATPase [Rhodoplanes tepidamans]MDC7983725.1 AAA family ATPase [Rhodoplanes sp. TEM]MDQ0358155.1 succinoglycan biosynthesis transport protein ExoP [Rhodoplanes tepidamans]